MIARKTLLLKSIAVFLLLSFVTEVIFPTAVLALTNGPTSPDVYGNQPVDATDNVSLVTGDFNYTIPITSIPEYPMAVGYSTSGLGMDQEAGTFGFGVNAFTGAIARNIEGLPDDLNNGPRRYKSESQRRWDASVKGSMALTDIPVGDLPVQVSPSVSLTVGYNNYTGMYGALGVGLGFKILPVEDGTPITGNLGFKTSSYEGASADVGIQYGIFSYSAYGTDIKHMHSKISVFKNVRYLLKNGISDASEALNNIVNAYWNVSVTEFPSFNGTVTSSYAPLADVTATYNSFGVATPGIPIGPVTVSGTFSIENMGNDNNVKDSYGFMYLKNYDNSKRSNLGDMTVEGEFSYNNVSGKDFRNSPAYLQRDAFTISSQGMSGTMQMYQDQYGTVSRNYNRYQARDLSFIGLNTERKEVEAWTNVSKAAINKNLDILKLLKSSDEEGDKDFDNTIFIEKQLVDLRSSDRTFGNEAKFKMRGDMAGEFNLSSSSSSDYAANKYELVHISGTGGDSKFSFLKEEKDMPMYYPNPVKATRDKYNNANNKIQNSTYIKSYKVRDLIDPLVSAYPASTRTIDPATSSDQAAVMKFIESFYSHKEIKNSVTLSKGNPVELKDGTHLEDFNILKHIADLKGSPINSGNNNTYFDDLVADIRVKNAEGLTYIYNLPVFCKGSKTLSMNGKGAVPPVGRDGNDYTSLSGNKNRNKVAVSEEYYYPYAWLLTAVVGSDYIDFDDIPGPSDGDLGYWVKFKYVKTADNYRWRAPFRGLEHLPNAIHDYSDDAYTASTGLKEMYQVYEIESSLHVSRYTYHQRLDGVDAGGGSSFGDIYNGDAINSLSQKETASAAELGNNTQFVCTKIQLFKKHAGGENSKISPVAEKSGKLLRETKLWYDYSLCPNVYNNYARYSSIMQSNVPYHIGTSSSTHAGTGKLTLQKVQHISYEGGSAVTLPSYELQYKHEEPGSIAEANPSYDRNQVDQWGNYSKLSKEEVNTGSPVRPINFYQRYNELSKTQADNNAQAFKLSKVYLPAGGVMSVNYEANSYGKVQDQTPYVMRHVWSSVSKNDITKTFTVKVDITDLSDDGKNLNAVLKAGQSIYGELAFYESFSTNFPRREDQVYISSDEPIVVSIGSITTQGSRKYQELELRMGNNTDFPFYSKYKAYLYGASNKYKAVKENLSGGCNVLDNILEKYENMDKDSPLDALNKMIANTRNYFVGDAQLKDKFTSCFDDPDANLGNVLYKHLSFIRTPVYKAKYTGSKVKSITFLDNFQYATNASGTGIMAHDNTYTTNYYSDDLGNGKGNSMGVATIEPGGGKSAVIDIYNKKGAGFMPGPSIMYAKSTMETGYAADLSNPNVGDKISRKKGKTEYHFYTAADSEYKFDKNLTIENKMNQPGNPNGRFFMFGVWSFLYLKFRIFRKRIVIKLPLWIPLTVRWKREDKYHMQSYAYLDQSDMYGRPKKIVSLDATNVEVSSQQFNYFGRNELVQTYDGTTTGTTPVDPYSDVTRQKLIKPGKMDQVWSEAYYTKESRIQLIPWILFLNAHTERNFSYTNMKYTYLPPVLKEVVNVNAVDGSIVKSSYTGFDYLTCQPLEIRNTDSYNKTKIQRVVPAYWKYPEMGNTTDLAQDNLNLLTQSTGNYMYLNTVSNNTVLSVGIQEWSKSSWQMVPGIRKTGKQYQSGYTTFNYQYASMTADDLEKMYNANGKTRTVTPENKYVRDVKYQYKPVKTYVYKTTENADGTFALTNFNYSGAQTDAKWTLLNTVTKYDLDGNAVEIKDILDKYASAYFGYNFANAVATASNASYNTAAYSGAENTYVTTGGTVLDDSRITLVDTEVLEECDKSFIDKTMVYNNFTSGGGARLLTVCVPTNPTLNTPFAKVDIVYAHNTSIKRSLYLSLDDNREFRIMSDRGEVYKGFYVTPTTNLSGCMVTYKLGFDPSIFQSFTLDNTFTNSGYSVTSSTGTLPACALPNKVYPIPATNCIGVAHTGKYAFGLKSNTIGTRFEINTASLPVTERNRKYKAMVWVHNSSPSQTTLLARRVLSSGNVTFKTATLSSPYVTIGEWSLLRIVVEPADYAGADGIVFAVQNPSSGMAIFDDFRVLPYQASMTNSVYDHFTGRVTATLDGENFATFYKYDAKGRLIEVKAEIENAGKQTIKKYLYNEQKTN